MKHFIIKAAKNKDLLAQLSEPTDFLYLTCSGLPALKKTMRCISPKGYRIRTAAWFSKHLRTGYVELIGSLFQRTMFEIKVIPETENEFKEIEFTNSFNITQKLRIINESKWETKLK